MTKKTYLHLDSPVQYIKGVGPKRATYFGKIGVETVHDLMRLVPRRYVDYSTVMKIRDVRINDEATVIGRIEIIEARRTRKRVHLVTSLLRDTTGSIVLKWFNRPDLRKKFKVGDSLLVSGKVTFYRSQQLINPLYEIIGEEETEQKKQGEVIPIYPLTEGLSIWDVRRAARIALDACLNEIRETLPQSLIDKHGLLQLRQATRHLHFPDDLKAAQAARRRLVYDEFFFFELTLARRKAKLQERTGIAFQETGTLTRQFIQKLPFTMTQGQATAMREIAADMQRERPMNRLLQGDVGSGKTVVSLYAILIAIENDYQAVLMAPTEILAEQHYLVLQELLSGIGIKPYLLTGSIKGKDRGLIADDISKGKAKLVLGTHALIEEDLTFDKLGLVVVDEQHRFGVMQRAALVGKGANPDFLVLSATPIPRTLALTLYGDLDISIIKEKPPKRGEVITKIVNDKEKPSTFAFIRNILSQGHQAFVICPIIEKSETTDLRSVQEVTEEITEAFPDFSVGIIHGRLSTADRMQIMNDYRLGKIAVLVATTVVEVGVDIPNATIMIIEHPERFGLAQLHQLRGRIGRGAQRSYCFLVLSRYLQSDTYERIEFFSKNSDGFALAQMDIKLRGPGQVLGKRQHGLPDINIGDLEFDRDLLYSARDDAFGLVKEDPDLSLPENHAARVELEHLAHRAELLRIG
ncbi:MAG: ATP-dependent DNA helicase RecG [candidate division WOR-3 bacterium]|nr:MAG: ATP-dependent DNA helicase RecG [candidate division WOR-3 bacterium]